MHWINGEVSHTIEGACILIFTIQVSCPFYFHIDRSDVSLPEHASRSSSPSVDGMDTEDVLVDNTDDYCQVLSLPLPRHSPPKECLVSNWLEIT